MPKAEWRNHDFSIHPELKRDYELFIELTLPDGIIATVECFAMNPTVFYANTIASRSGAMSSLDRAKEWCEYITNNKVN